MKKLATLILACAVLLPINAGAQTNENMENPVIKNIMTRTSVRQYKNQPVEKDKIETLLRAGMAAPSAVNKQPWHFVVVTDAKQLEAIADANPNAGMCEGAPLAIVVCGDISKALEGGGRDFWIQDASAASENILLAANGIGLGGVWTGTYPNPDRVKAISQVLKLSAHIIPLNTLVIGYPDGTPTPKDKWKPENVSYNTYGGK